MFARLWIPAATGLGSALLFQVQPLVAKWFLPWFGGGASVWTACMLFFQVVLVGGYLYAHGLTLRLGRRGQAALHLGLLLVAVTGLAAAALSWPSPLTPGPSWRPGLEAPPLPSLLGLLALSTGVPFLTLATTGPLLQAWFVRLAPGRSPYPLYAVSNAGSLVGLLSYPLLVEPRLDVPAQAWLWTGGFAVYVLLVAATAVAQSRAGSLAPETVRPSSDASAPDSAGRGGSGPAWWIAYAATASLALLAVTNRLTLEVAPVPFLWVVPLAIYLVTFIACFGRSRRYRKNVWGLLLLGSAASTALALLHGSGLPLPLQIGTLLILLLSLCMVCHGELASSAPHPSRLTAFYLSISVGGALGGILAAVVAPALFQGLWELPIAAYLGVVLLLASYFREASPRFFGTPARRRATLAASALVFAVLGTGLGWTVFSERSGTILSSRNFYGWFVVDQVEVPNRPGEHYLRLVHGGIVHGAQLDVPHLRRLPTAYFGPNSGVGRAIRSAVKEGEDESRGIRVGVVGFGVGTLGAWARPQDTYRFYEINPDVIALSTGPRPVFTYLSDPGGKKEITLGDARLSMEREAAQNYDVLVLDAFSSDAIPVHLLTLEAFRLYRSHLAGPRSILAVHVSNDHLDLEPTVRALARATGFYGVTVWERAKGLALTSQWLVLSPSRERLRVPELSRSVEPWDGPERPVRVWTDAYSDVLGTFRLLGTRRTPSREGTTGR
ncbi:MAG TPA: fused MFS/spermidine synthase [Thermoanaerobaculia bacterium]|jgi:hypothetical protein|nr:fused MFS/spermidine synthase [Thermoanaerobaculia bacterium]HPA52670.1 fused MFS/spermidine synthase [Thermoanaerobaculia bacterium]HQN07236.1 fused MFS/spermidine synthase [Thermoanaerobaculia bacterium]HQP84891.1 fused MFS/spermidine synthase [Thermoanaerobaculia bacterium]